MHQLLLFSGGVFGSDSQPSANTVVERDSNGAMWGAGVNGNSYVAAGGLYVSKATYTAAATVSTTVTVAECNATTAAFTLTLPPASASADQFFIIIKTDSSGHLVTIAGGGSDTINGAATYTGLSAQWDVVRLYCDSTQWLIV
jgi:hypothetical protein